MKSSKGNLFTRDDTFLGVCEGIGEDLGFNPVWLRAALGVLLLWNPTVVVATYLGLAIIVLTSRLLCPNPKAAADAAAHGRQASENDDVVAPVAQAA